MKLQLVYPLTDEVLINYFGIKFNIPTKYTHIATDANGQIFVYTTEPKVASKDYWQSYVDGNETHLLAIVDLEAMDWKATLRAIEDCEVK